MSLPVIVGMRHIGLLDHVFCSDEVALQVALSAGYKEENEGNE